MPNQRRTNKKGYKKGYKKGWKKSGLGYNPRFSASSRPELKAKDNDFTLTPSVAGTSASPLGTIAVDTLKDARLGDRIVVGSYQQRATITIDPTSTSGYVHLRHLILIDKQPNHTTFTPAGGVFADGGNPITSPLNLEYTSRFNVLCDRVITLDSESYKSKVFTFYKKFNMPVSYRGSTTEVPETNNILTMWFTNEPLEGGKYPTIIGLDRIRFSDA